MPWLVQETRDYSFIWDVALDPSVLPGIRSDKLPSIEQMVKLVEDKNRYYYQCGKGGVVCFFPNPRGTLDIHISFKSGHRGPPARKATMEAVKQVFQKIQWLPRIEARFSKRRMDVFKFLSDCGFKFMEHGELMVGMIERQNVWAC